jgi:membrane carboxypeptidase/penicillin-binding protein
MDIISKLIVLTFFSLHQYVPENKMQQKYFNTTVDPVSLNLMSSDGIITLSAANQTCRALFAEMQEELDMTKTEVLSFAFHIVDEHADKLLEENSSADLVKSTISKICADNFTSRAFTAQETADIQSFLTNELLILSTQDIESLGNLRYFGKTNLYDRHGQFIDSLFSQTENWLAYPQISPHVAKALIAAEDSSFWLHEGVDMTSMVRMAVQMKSTSDESQLSGGSTLTMQLLKNFYFLGKESASGNSLFRNSSLNSLLRKIREWFWAKPYEMYWDAKNPGTGKKVVLENYLNMMDYGPGIRGIDQAAKTFFAKEAIAINIPEAAFIASLFKRPNRYSLPSNYESYTKGRRHYVLEQMSKLTWESSLLEPISQNELLQAQATPLPQWEQKSNQQTVSDSSIYLELMARNYVSEISANTLGAQVIQPELVTTIDMNLQDLVRKIILNKIDSYDRDRSTESRIEAARNDRSRFAQIDATDITSELRDTLTEVRNLLGTEGQGVDFVISLASQNTTQFYFHPNNSVIRTTQEVLNVSDFANKKFSLGEVIAIWTNPQDCQSILDIFSPPTGDAQTSSQTPLEILRLMSPCFKAFDVSAYPQISTQKVKSLLIQSALQKMLDNTPREYMIPAFLSKDGANTNILINDEQGVAEIRLTQEHQRILNSKMQRKEILPEQIVWVSNAENSNSYTLQSPKLQAAAIVMNSNTGEVLAQFGGYNPQTSRFFDRSNISRRPVGSTLKPWIYYLALTKGFRPDSLIQNSGVSFRIDDNSNYVPDNFDGGGGSPQVTLEQALTQSINKPAVGLLTNSGFGPDRFDNLREFVDFLVEIDLYSSASVQYRPSIVLGAQELTVEKLASSFSFFSNGQKIVKPVYFKTFKNGRGEDISPPNPFLSTNVPFSENRQVVFDIQRLLVQVANVGTAKSLRDFPGNSLGLNFCDGSSMGIPGQICFGGKTGTSSNSHDNWFIGFSRNFVIAVWVGYDSPASTGSTGGALALPIFMDIVKEGLPLLPPVEPIF